MATVDHTFTVEAPPAVVFAYLTDLEKAVMSPAVISRRHLIGYG